MSNPPDVIENYLDQVCRHLQVIPAEELAEIRSELREHLQLSVDAIVSEGVDRHDAEMEAIRRFGPASRIGNQMLASFPYVWTWDWDGYSNGSLPKAPVSLRIYLFWCALFIPAVSTWIGPVFAIGAMVFAAAAFGAAFESYHYFRDSYKIEARSPFAWREDVRKRVETAVNPARLYQQLGFNKLPSTMRRCRQEELPSVLSSNIGTLLFATIFADIGLYHDHHYYHHHLIKVGGISVLSYVYVLGATACRVFLRGAARRPGLLFTFREHADVEAS